MAAAALKIALNPNPNPNLNGVVSPRRCAYSSGTIKISTLSNCSKSNPPFSCPTSTQYERTYANRFKPVRISGSNRVSGSDTPSFDVVIVGAGIIGLTIARQLLLGSNLSVAVVDAAVPCAGATGAGTKWIFYLKSINGFLFIDFFFWAMFWLIVGSLNFIPCLAFELIVNFRAGLHMEGSQSSGEREMGAGNEKPSIVGGPGWEHSESRHGSFTGTWMEEDR